MPTATPPQVVKVFELINDPSWKAKETKDGVTWFKGKVDYCETDAAKFTVAMPEVHAANVAEMLDDEALTLKYDKDLDKRIIWDTMEKEFSVPARRYRVQFKSPMFLVGPREFTTVSIPHYFLNEEEKKRFQVGHPGLDVAVFCGVHDAEPTTAEGFVRGTMHVFGWIAVDVPEGGCVYTQVSAMELGGSLPISLVNKVVGEQVPKLKKQRTVFTEEEKRVGRKASPGPTLAATTEEDKMEADGSAAA